MEEWEDGENEGMCNKEDGMIGRMRGWRDEWIGCEEGENGMMEE